MNKNILCGIIVVSIIFIVSLSPLTILDVKAQEENTWTSLAPMQEKRYGLGVAEINGKIYAISGYVGSGPFSNATEEYNPTTNTWTYKKAIPTPRTYFAIAVYQNKIYCMGGLVALVGYNSQILTDSVEVYDPTTDTWENKTSMPNVRIGMSASVVNGMIYVIGGDSRITHVYNPINDSWETKASVPSSLDQCVSVVLDGKIHAFGALLVHYIYDPEIDTWETGESKNTNIYFPVAAVTTGIYAPKRIYVLGAAYPYWNNPSNISPPEGSIYDLKTGNWTKVASIPVGHFAGGAVVIEDRIYLIGGGESAWAGGLWSSDYNDMYTPFLFGSTPEVSINSPENMIYTQTNIPLEFLVNEATSWMGYSLNDQENVTVTGNTNLTILMDGTHTLGVYAIDMAGDEGSSVVTFIVDVNPPVVFVLSPENKTYSDSNILLNVEFEEQISKMQYSLDGYENITFTEDITLSELEVGKHNVTVYAIDLAGHTGVSEIIYFSVEPFPTTLVILSVVVIAIIGLGILAYYKKYRK